MKMEFSSETIAVVLIIVAIIAFLLFLRMRNMTVFKRANTALARLEQKDKIYVQIRKMLREKLVPLGFTEEEIVALGNIAKYQRDGFLVELYFDYREREYSFFASSGVQDPIHPPRQVSVTFFSSEYNAEKKQAVSEALQEWLKSIGSQ